MENWQEEILNVVNLFENHLADTYTIQQKADVKDIEVFENRFDVKLPQDFRWFVLNIGNGIVTNTAHRPYLLESIDFASYRYFDDEYNPGIEFSLSSKVVFGSREHYEDNSNYPYEVYFDDDDTIFMSKYLNGMVTIAAYGCGTTSNLIVKGKEYGNVWMDDFASNNEIFPEYDSTKNLPRLTFTQWLAQRVNQTIKSEEQYKSWKKSNPDPVIIPPVVQVNERKSKQTFWAKVWEALNGD